MGNRSLAACIGALACLSGGPASAATGVEHILQGRIVVRDPDNTWGGRTARCSAKLNVVDFGGDAGMNPGTDVGPTEFGTFTMPESNDPKAREAASPGAATFYSDKACHLGNHLGATLKEFSCAFVGTNGKGDDFPQNKFKGTVNPNSGKAKGTPQQAQPGDTHWVEPQTAPKIDSYPPDDNFDNPVRTGEAKPKRDPGKGYRWGDGNVTIDFFWSSHKCEMPPPKKKKKLGEDDEEEPKTPPNDGSGKGKTPTTQEKAKPAGKPKKPHHRHRHGRVTEDNPNYMENYTPPATTRAPSSGENTDSGQAPPPPQNDQNNAPPNNDYQHAPDIPVQPNTPPPN